MSTNMGDYRGVIHGCSNLDYSKVQSRISHTQKWLWFGNGNYVGLESNQKMWSTHCLHIPSFQ